MQLLSILLVATGSTLVTAAPLVTPTKVIRAVEDASPVRALYPRISFPPDTLAGLWSDAGFGGNVFIIPGSKDGVCITLSGFNDVASSLQFQSASICTVFIDAGCSGRAAVLTKSSLQFNNTFNDKVSSIRCNR
ncbi:hypothetical protein BJ875DRAFT_71938 [Amylocarpus encephaloides]|uniref:Uncharacterized protein n=1 Tax=Amylocarpus encephaloides TaxID=45428 RepID=A0A9P8C3N8_9HELO|nr:hypothetical protein BJ875DRAFT_71938 [Amylocarpus encephaloides]